MTVGMLRVGVGDEVMAPRPNGEGALIWSTARVVVIMPELVIVEYRDARRHCLPKNLLRAPTVRAA